MKHGTMQLVKFKKLHRRLGFKTTRETAGLLEVMWLVAARETPRGDIGQMDNETIAIELEWDGDPDYLVEALVETRWLDHHPEHRIIVHDWADHAARFVHGVASKKGGIIESTVDDYSERLQSRTTVDDVTHDSRQPAGAGTTIPSLTIPNHTKEKSAPDGGSLSDYGSGTDETKKPRGPAYRPERAKLPFASERFRHGWLEWVQHRREIKKKLTPTAVEKQLKALAEMGEQRALAAIDHTIRNGWVGIREPENPRAGPPKEFDRPKLKTAAELLNDPTYD